MRKPSCYGQDRASLRLEDLRGLSALQLRHLPVMDDNITCDDLWLIHEVLAEKLATGDCEADAALVDIQRRMEPY